MKGHKSFKQYLQRPFITGTNLSAMLINASIEYNAQ